VSYGGQCSHEAGLITFGFIAADGAVWDANWTNAWFSQSLNVETGEWLPIAVWHISGISAALWVSISVWLGKVPLLVKLKPKTQCGLEFVFKLLSVGVIYILATVMYLGSGAFV
jgi:APA family basic amino acid/polyamine antiporter